VKFFMWDTSNDEVSEWELGPDLNWAGLGPQEALVKQDLFIATHAVGPRKDGDYLLLQEEIECNRMEDPIFWTTPDGVSAIKGWYNGRFYAMLCFHPTDPALAKVAAEQFGIQYNKEAEQ
jgi:hypothetical protein